MDLHEAAVRRIDDTLDKILPELVGLEDSLKALRHMDKSELSDSDLAMLDDMVSNLNNGGFKLYSIFFDVLLKRGEHDRVD